LDISSNGINKNQGQNKKLLEKDTEINPLFLNSKHSKSANKYFPDGFTNIA